MSAISGFINQILTAVYGEQVRGAIVSALEQCYSDVSSPSLNTAAFSAAIEAAYANGFLDIQEKSTIAGMTNTKIIYRYTGNQSGYVNGALYYYDGTKWTPIGSALQIASSAALMTDQGAIYKYTGSESGYINGALYYYDGTAFVPLMNKEHVDTALSSARDNLILDLTEGASGNGTNLVDPNNIKNLGYYYDTSDGVTHIASNSYKATEKKIRVGNNGVALYLVKRDTSYTFYGFAVLCYDADENYLGQFTLTSQSNIRNLVTLKRNTEYINIQYSSGAAASEICLVDTPTTVFIPYAGIDIDDRVIKTSLLDKSAITADILEKDSSGANVIDPSNLTAWGYSMSGYDGTTFDASAQYQITKNPISSDGNRNIYVRVRNPLSSSSYYVQFFGFASDGTYKGDVRGSLITTDEQTLTLPTGTDYFYVQINNYETAFNPSDLCVSFESLDSFEAYSYTLKIKSDLLNSDALIKNSKKSTLYKKNAVIFGDSLIQGNSTLVEGIRTMTGLSTIYNAGIGGTSMEIRGETGVFGKWWTMVNIADCIASGNWTDTITGLENDTDARAAQALVAANYLKDVDFSKIDLIIIAHGANDNATDSETSPYDTSTYGGAIRHVIDVITTAYPNIKLVFCSVIYKTADPQSSVQKLNILKGACNDFFVQYIDNLTELGINANNASYYLADGLHASTKGYELMRDHIVHSIW